MKHGYQLTKSYTISKPGRQLCNQYLCSMNVFLYFLRLLACGLSLLQGDVLPRSLSKNVLRERIYCNCLDYFCCPPSCPIQRGAELREDILVLVRFWQTMHSDKKYLKASVVGGKFLLCRCCPRYIEWLPWQFITQVSCCLDTEFLMTLNVYMKFEVFIALQYLVVAFSVVTFKCDGPNKDFPLLCFHWPRQGPVFCIAPVALVGHLSCTPWLCPCHPYTSHHCPSCMYFDSQDGDGVFLWKLVSTCKVVCARN